MSKLNRAPVEELPLVWLDDDLQSTSVPLQTRNNRWYYWWWVKDDHESALRNEQVGVLSVCGIGGSDSLVAHPLGLLPALPNDGSGVARPLFLTREEAKRWAEACRGIVELPEPRAENLVTDMDELLNDLRSGGLASRLSTSQDGARKPVKRPREDDAPTKLVDTQSQTQCDWNVW